MGRSIRSGWRLLMLVLMVLGTPALVQAQPATPATGAPASMTGLLGLMPVEPPGLEDPAGAMIAWVDIAAQLEAVGVTPPDAMDDPGFEAWSQATRSLALPGDAASFLRDWRQDYGFDLLQVDQVLSVQLPPFNLAIYRGRLDTAAIVAALDEIGYQRVEVGGHELLSIRGDFEIDIDGPTTYRMAGMNFGVVLDDETVAFSASGAPLAAVLDVAAGRAPSMMELAGVATVVEAAPPDLVSALLVHGTQLAQSIPPAMLDVVGEGTPDLDAIATAAATEIAAANELPPVLMGLLGSTAGGPVEGALAAVPDARAVAVLLLPDPTTASAAPPVIEERLATGVSAETEQSYTEIFAEWSVSVAAEEPVVVVDFALAEGTPPNILTRMLFARDLGFLAW